VFKSKRSLSDNQLEAEEISDVVYEEESYLNITCRAFCNAQWKKAFEVGIIGCKIWE
jgi:hypothetical protein